jgi:hypothetical protein
MLTFTKADHNRSFHVNGNPMPFNVGYNRDPKTGKAPDYMLLDAEVMPLIMAAPELLEVLRKAEQWAMLTQTDCVPWLDAASNAITKAAGKER